MVRPVKKEVAHGPEGRPTLLDWYQGLMRSIWRKIGVRPEWVHGLDEMTSTFMICGYALSLLMIMTRPAVPKASFTGAPAWGNLSEMLCRTDREVGAGFEYQENGLRFSGHSNVHFIISDPHRKPDVLVAVPRRLNPFNREGYRAVTGAINQAVCDIQTDVLSYVPRKFETNVAFGFGETVGQIVEASQQLQLQTGIVVKLLSQRGYRQLVAGDTGYLGKVLCPKCARDGLSGISQLIKVAAQLKKKLGDSNLDDLDLDASEHDAASPLDVTFQTFTGLKGDELEVGYDIEIAELVLQNVLDKASALQLGQIQQIWGQLDKMLSNERMKHQIQYAPETLLKAQNVVVQAATLFGFNISLTRGGLLLLGYFLVLPLAINLNVWHKRARGRFIRSLFKAFNVRFIVFMVSYAAGYVLMLVGSILFKGRTGAGRVFDVDSLPKLAATLCVGCYFILANFSGKKMDDLEVAELSQQRNTAILLLWYFFAAFRRSPEAILLAQVILLSHLGYYVVEYATRRRILCRVWTVNAVNIILSFTMSSAVVLQHVHLDAIRGLEFERNQLTTLFAACWVFSLILGFIIPVLRHVQGRLVCGVFLCAAIFFFWQQQFQNPVERVIIEGFSKKAKGGAVTPSQAGLNKVKAFCDAQKLACTVFLESGKKKEVPFTEEKFTLFNERVEVKLSTAEPGVMTEEADVDLAAGRVHLGAGEYIKIQPNIASPVYWRAQVETWLKK